MTIDGAALIGSRDVHRASQCYAMNPATIRLDAEDGGEEPEIAGIDLVGDDGQPVRLGFVPGNEFSDHVCERQNYLWLAHSKLRQAALAPELLLGDLPPAVTGTSRILRGDAVLWEKPFLSGEANMSHTIANFEHHHVPAIAVTGRAELVAIASPNAAVERLRGYADLDAIILCQPPQT